MFSANIAKNGYHHQYPNSEIKNIKNSISVFLVANNGNINITEIGNKS
jgi:hypothetical protein